MVLIQGNYQEISIVYIKTNKHHLLLRYISPISLSAVINFMTEKIIEAKKKKLVNLASVMVDKYLVFDNPLSRNSETERPIPDYQLKKSNINNMCS